MQRIWPCPVPRCIRLSVPCVRVECLQLGRLCHYSRHEELSVPCVRVECLQPPKARHAARPGELSVPCVRVECLQLIDAGQMTDPLDTFSTLCSGRVFATLSNSGHVRVSSTFSTLCSGRVFATTMTRLDTARQRFSFSTLCSGRVFATCGCPRPCCVPVGFQYPVFGSSVCNFFCTHSVFS